MNQHAAARRREPIVLVAILALSLAAPFLAPSIVTQMTFLWIMVVFALTWDTMGGQMGYNSFGNILFFGIGAYACAIVQRDLGLGYFDGIAAGLAAAAVLAACLALIAGSGMLGLRGHYFAIGTLGLGIAGGELAAGWDYIGAGAGMTTPLYPGEIADRRLFFYALSFALAAATFFALRRLYAGKFGLAINAIRDDEDKAEAMGLPTTRYKTIAWCISAFFVAIAGGIVGNVIGFIDPRDVAFAGATYGVWMVLMAILGGKGTLWGPVIGAAIFHVTQELFWTYLLGWQRVALGLLIVLIVVFFPVGILGWLREKRPELFGYRVEAGPGDGGGGGPVSALIEVERLTKSFGGVIANSEVSLHVDAGEIVGLIGPNGSGKTTLFNSIVGYHPIDKGSIRFKGREISRLRVPEIARLGLIRTFQQTRVYRKMTCTQNMLISLPHRHEGLIAILSRHAQDDIARAEELLEFVGLYSKRSLRAGDLSFGQQKLLEFAMALMNEPQVLLLDEPTAGINPTLINGLIDRLKRANADLGITLFVIEHNMRVIMNLAERIYCLAHGKLLAEGRPAEIQGDQRVIDAYLGAH